MHNEKDKGQKGLFCNTNVLLWLNFFKMYTLGKQNLLANWKQHKLLIMVKCTGRLCSK